jgi:hypothetical protein
MSDPRQRADSATEVGNDSDSLLGQILDFVHDSQNAGSEERRFRDRYAINCKMQLTPIGRDGTSRSDETILIFGKDLSRRGISFSHDRPLAHQQVLISLTLPEAGQFVVQAQITWTRLSPIGLYESGCRLIRKVDGCR